MRELAPDISVFLTTHFGGDATEAEVLLQTYIGKHPVEKRLDESWRVLRCIAFLAKGSIPELKRMIEAAEQDWRDVIFRAEYVDWTATNPRRVRNFNNSFGAESLVQ
ncbi:MAG TPA: hypothetical protein PK280_09035 [Planctomycetota bacterium]|nr:hypothetical protein [Planctomycetota bacterium]